jgi:NADPH:quinone reductase-like Zn-dependent oxidoreductase
MKSYVIERYGDSDGLVTRDTPIPSASPGQVLVRLHAAALNARDLMIVAGAFKEASKPNLVPLSDGAGEVIAVGEGVWRVRVGDRVTMTFNPHWIAGDFVPTFGALGRGAAVDGVLSQYTCVGQEEVVHLPAHLSYAEGATLPCAAVTAWTALCGYGVLRPGQNVLVQGTGGVSLFALQFARMFGARVIATTSSAAKIQRLVSLGADAVIDTKANPDWAPAVLKHTNGEGVDVVVDIGGGAGIQKSVQATRECGRVSVVGLFNGMPDVGAGFFMRGVTLNPIRVGSREHFEQMNRAIDVHRMKPIIDRVFDFDDIGAALTYLAGGTQVGKVVIKIV